LQPDPPSEVSEHVDGNGGAEENDISLWELTLAQICIGGVCIPVYALIPLAVLVLNNVWTWFRNNVLGQSDEHLFHDVRGFLTCHCCIVLIHIVILTEPSDSRNIHGAMEGIAREIQDY
jgi:hypothetical protein